MADRKDELEARRRFRQRLAELDTQYPELKDPEHRQRLTEALEKGDIFMPRTPTGRPVGRPKGTGKLGEEGQGHTRLTVRIPQPLYDALAAGPLDLAQTVRTALEAYLYKRQTETVPPPSMAHNGQTETVHVPLGDTRGQTESVPALAENTTRQTEIPQSDPAHVDILHDSNADMQDGVPTFDEARYYLGKLCPQKHEYAGTGQSLLRKHNMHCRECERLSKRAARAAKRQARVLD